MTADAVKAVAELRCRKERPQKIVDVQQASAADISARAEKDQDERSFAEAHESVKAQTTAH